MTGPLPGDAFIGATSDTNHLMPRCDPRGVSGPRGGKITVARRRLAAGLVRVPEGSGDVPVALRLVVEVVDGHHEAVGPLHAARVAEVAPAAVGPQDDLRSPGPAAVPAQPRANAVGGRAVAVGQAEPAVLQADQARRVAL